MKNNSLTFPDFSTKIFTFPDYPENDTILPDFPVCINPVVGGQLFRGLSHRDTRHMWCYTMVPQR